MKRHVKPSATIYDVANAAGVAISTVSRVLNNSPDVSENTRRKVERAIEELKYHPNRTARSLAQQEYHSFAVALPSFTVPFQTEMLKGIRSFLQEIDHDLLICDLGSTDQVGALHRFLNRGAVRGLLLCGVVVDEALARELSSFSSPTVLVGHSHPAFDSFCWDDAAGARAAVTHLIQQGHHDIAMIRSGVASSMQDDRTQGYRDALTAAGLTVNENRIVSGRPQYHGGFSEEDGYDAMQSILDSMPECTAVFCSSDVQAIGALAALRERKVLVPEQMAIVGYDDIKTSRFLGLSSVDQSMQKMGYQAASKLQERIDSMAPDGPSHILVEPRLEVRTSSLHPRTV